MEDQRHLRPGGSYLGSASTWPHTQGSAGRDARGGQGHDPRPARGPRPRSAPPWPSRWPSRCTPARWPATSPGKVVVSGAGPIGLLVAFAARGPAVRRLGGRLRRADRSAGACAGKLGFTRVVPGRRERRCRRRHVRRGLRVQFGRPVGQAACLARCVRAASSPRSASCRPSRSRSTSVRWCRGDLLGGLLPLRQRDRRGRRAAGRAYPNVDAVVTHVVPRRRRRSAPSTVAKDSQNVRQGARRGVGSAGRVSVSSTPPRVGCSAPGLMGAPMASHIAGPGIPTTVWARRRPRPPLALRRRRHHRRAATPAELGCTASDVIIAMLPDLPHLEALTGWPRRLWAGRCGPTSCWWCPRPSPRAGSPRFRRARPATDDRRQGARHRRPGQRRGGQGDLDGTLSIMVGGRTPTWRPPGPVLECLRLSHPPGAARCRCGRQGLQPAHRRRGGRGAGRGVPAGPRTPASTWRPSSTCPGSRAWRPRGSWSRSATS
jgi:hypothetical protein